MVTLLLGLGTQSVPTPPLPQPTPQAASPTSDVPVVSVWNKESSGEWVMRGQIHTFGTLEVETRHLQPGMWSLSMPFNNQALLLTRKRVVTVDWRGQRFTGLVETLSPQSDEQGQPTLEVSGSGALALLGDALCYPDPTSGAGAQLQSRYQDLGPAESVLRSVIQANYVARNDTAAVVIPASTARGATVHLNLFFDNLLEVLLKKATRGGIGVRMGLASTGTPTRAKMTVEFYVPTDRSNRVRLSHKVGTLRSWKQSTAVPTGTRAIVASAVEGTSNNVSDVDLTANSLTTDSPHGFRTGDLILFHGNSLPAPLSDGAYYFAIRSDANTFKVAQKRARALSHDPINLTDVGGLKVDSVNVTSDNITVTRGTVPDTGQRFRIIGAGTPPAPLAKGTTYFSIRVDRDTIKAAASSANATAGTAIDLTTAGSGDFRVFEINARDVVQVGRRIVTTQDTAAEDEWGRRREVFVDARGDDADDAAVFIEKGQEALDEMVAQSSFELEATDAEGMRYGTHFTVGDLVTVQLQVRIDGTLVDIASEVQPLTAARLTFDTNGRVLQLVPGNPDGGDPAFKQAAVIRNVRERVRNLEQEES